jgi:hypothetical protein
MVPSSRRLDVDVGHLDRLPARSRGGYSTTPTRPVRAQVRIDVGEHLQCPFLDAVSQHLPSSRVRAATRGARFRGAVGAHERADASTAREDT